MMAKFRRKPVVIEAEQFRPDTSPWPEGVIVNEFSFTGYSVDVNHGTIPTFPGDWIITCTNNRKHPCNPDIFKQFYEPVEE